MPNVFNLALFTDDSDVHAVIETPRGSHVKFVYGPKLKDFVLRKSLLTGLTDPHDWGFATEELEDKKLRIMGSEGPKPALIAIRQAAKSFAKPQERRA